MRKILKSIPNSPAFVYAKIFSKTFLKIEPAFIGNIIFLHKKTAERISFGSLMNPYLKLKTQPKCESILFKIINVFFDRLPSKINDSATAQKENIPILSSDEYFPEYVIVETIA